MSERPAIERAVRPVAASQHETSELIMPHDANILGHAFGGAIMAWWTRPPRWRHSGIRAPRV